MNQAPPRPVTSPTLDSKGQPITVHGGTIILVDGLYHWYGEHKVGQTMPARVCDYRLDFAGIACYTSPDLIAWDFAGVVLSPSDTVPELHSSRVVERPKVLLDPKSGQFVMWLHIDNPDYTLGNVGVAVSASATGPFRFVRSFRPNGADCRDFTLFIDTDDSAYLVHSSDWNRTLRIARLSGDYLDTTGEVVPAFIGQCREAPVLWKHNERYYMITSGLTGWYPNPPLWGVASQMLGEWLLQDNPFSSHPSRTGWGTQGAFIIPKPDTDDKFIYAADRWVPHNLASSEHVWFEVEMSPDGPRLSSPI